MIITLESLLYVLLVAMLFPATILFFSILYLDDRRQKNEKRKSNKSKK